MNDRNIKLPTIALIAGTRVALGFGLGLLLADRLSSERRRGAGWAFFAFGALSTIPLAIEVLGAPSRAENGHLGIKRTEMEPYISS
jgi:hypothetical protein